MIFKMYKKVCSIWVRIAIVFQPISYMYLIKSVSFILSGEIDSDEMVEIFCLMYSLQVGCLMPRHRLQLNYIPACRVILRKKPLKER